MAAEIKLPDGTPAVYDGKWFCADAKAIPMLEYFTERVFEEEYVTTFHNPYAGIAESVAARIVGAQLVSFDPIPFVPGEDDNPRMKH